MRKNGDVAAKAFLRYAAYGFDRLERDAFDMLDSIRGCTANREEAGRMLAVYDTLRLLDYEGRREELLALREVYFRGAGRRLRRNDITWRVQRFATDHFMDARTVYRRLARVKRLYFTVLEGAFKSGNKILKNL